MCNHEIYFECRNSFWKSKKDKKSIFVDYEVSFVESLFKSIDLNVTDKGDK